MPATHAIATACHAVLSSAWGTLDIVHNEDSLLGIYFPNHSPKPKWLLEELPKSADCEVLSQLSSQLQQYSKGERKTFDLPISFEGSELQVAVWNCLKQIPFGQTVSYQQLAAQAGYGHAVRAVGTAVGRNPLSLLVPCHRVIRSDGSLGGYAGGLSTKQQLLTLESRNS